jgi:ABC-type uncharacterized transport system YnjBCD ATPase subunit
LKTYRHLYPQVYAWENLELAYRYARKGKRARKPAAALMLAALVPEGVTCKMPKLKANDDHQTPS